MNIELINEIKKAISKKEISFNDDIAYMTFNSLLTLINYNKYPSLDGYQPSEQELEILKKGKSILTPSELDIHNKCMDLSYKLDIIINAVIVFIEHNKIVFSKQLEEMVEKAIIEAQNILENLRKTYQQVDDISINYNAELSRINNNYRVLGALTVDKSVIEREMNKARQNFIENRLYSFSKQKSN